MKGDTKVWYMVHRKVGKHDVCIFNNRQIANEFAKPTNARVERFENDTLAIGTAIQRGYRYKVERRHRIDCYTCEGPLKRVVVRDANGKVISRSVEPLRSIMKNHKDCVIDARYKKSKCFQKTIKKTNTA